MAIDLFLQENPLALVLFKGSTKSRNRLYRMRLRKYYTEIAPHVELFGMVNGKSFSFEEDVPVDFDSFLVKSNLEKNTKICVII